MALPAQLAIVCFDPVVRVVAEPFPKVPINVVGVAKKL